MNVMIKRPAGNNRYLYAKFKLNLDRKRREHVRAQLRQANLPNTMARSPPAFDLVSRSGDGTTNKQQTNKQPQKQPQRQAPRQNSVQQEERVETVGLTFWKASSAITSAVASVPATKYVIVMGFSVGGSLPSAVRDVAHVARFAEIHMGVNPAHICAMVESKADADTVMRFQPSLCMDNSNSNGPMMIIKSKRELFAAWSDQISKIRALRQQRPVELLLLMSSHGYSGISAPLSKEKDGRSEYIVIHGERVVDDDIFAQLVQPLMASEFTGRTESTHPIRCLAFVDTCSSGTMLDLDEHPDEKQKQKQPEAERTRDQKTDMMTMGQGSWMLGISACMDSQCSMDDFSSEFGFGGGLTSAMFDACNSNDSSSSSTSNSNSSSSSSTSNRAKASSTPSPSSTQREADFPDVSVLVSRIRERLAMMNQCSVVQFYRPPQLSCLGC